MNQTSSDDKKLIFISHKHIDSPIADVIRVFIEERSACQVKIFQSSSQWAEAPKAGRNLNNELMQALWETDVLILVYTIEDRDWSYCMWECGVASHPSSPETKIIVFQCGSSIPPLFTGQVNVNVRKLADIQNFTNDFMTSPDFFSGSIKPITGYSPNSKAVIDAASNFFETLKPVLPPEKESSLEEWPAYPFLQLELNLQKVDELTKNSENESLQNSHEIVLNESVVSDSDKYCSQLFNAMQLSHGTSLKNLVRMWKTNFPESKSKWAETLCNQIIAGSMWNFPSPVWELMEGMGIGNVWFAPMVNRVRKIPSRQCMQFDIYFYKFNINNQSNQIVINPPSK